MLEHLPLADAIASVMSRRLFPLVEREDLIQVTREGLLRFVPRCRAAEPDAPYLRRCITGALQHHLRDRVRLVRTHLREHERAPARSVTAASMPLPQVSTPSLSSLPPPSQIGLSAVLPMGWRWSAWWSSCPPARARPCGSPSSMVFLSGPPRHTCR